MAMQGVFDSGALALMQATLDHALAALPLDQQTVEARERIAQAILMLATEWERDRDQLGAVSLAERLRMSFAVD
jgi:hypothetical protein